MTNLTKFKISLFNFLNQYQMGLYKTGSDLSVLLIGYGQRMENILDSVIANGQLLDTNLSVTVCNTNPKGTKDSLLERAPYLPHFARININNAPIDTDIELDENLCTLFFDSAKLTPDAMESVIEARSECHYIIISCGKDDLNRELADAIAHYDWTEAVVIGYVQKKKSAAAIDATTDLVTVIPFGFDDDNNTQYSEDLEKIAKNIHYAYCRSAYDKISPLEIDASFHEEYNYLSNVESALHINSKILSCGIATTDISRKATEFSHMLEDHPGLVDRLAAVEHRRWLLSKVLAGFKQENDLNKIYYNDDGTHSSNGKWHTCLVPFGNSSIRNSDWAQAISGTIRKDLDPLDQMTLKIHARCKALSDTNTQAVDLLIQNIESLIGFKFKLLDELDKMKQAITEMRASKNSAVSLYNKYFTLLKNDILLQNTPSMNILIQALEMLDTTIAPLCEYASRKDYKEQDRILVRSIPFALDNKLYPSLVKLVSDNLSTNLLAMRQLSPSYTTFLGIARTLSDLDNQMTQIQNVKEYVSKYADAEKVAYRVIVPQQLYNDDTKVDKSQLIPIQEWTISVVQQVLAEEFTDGKLDYIDVTDGDPLLISAAVQHSQCGACGTFCVWHGKFRNLFGADALENSTLMPRLTVQDMFTLSGAVLNSTDSYAIAGLGSIYKDIWDIASKNSIYWKSLCKSISDSSSLLESFTISHTGISNICSISLAGSIERAFDAILPVLEDNGWIKSGTSKKTVDCNGITTISFILNNNVHDPKEFEAKIKQYNAYCDRPCYFEADTDSISLFDLSCRIPYDPALSDHNHIHKILNLLKGKRYILNYSKDDESNTFNFQFANNAISFLMHDAGRALETSLYYTALTQTDFDDVETGFYFKHSSDDDSAENEIDTICTRGQSSIFISAKDRNQENMCDKDYLRFLCYEIKSEAEHFGINAKAVLACPSLEMRNKSGEFTREFINCKKRGVYLLGKEAFDFDYLGSILVQIMDDNPEWYLVKMPAQKDDTNAITPQTDFQPNQVVTFCVTKKKSGKLQGTINDTTVEATLPKDQMNGLQRKKPGDSFKVCIDRYENGTYMLRRYNPNFDRFNER